MCSRRTGTVTAGSLKAVTEVDDEMERKALAERRAAIVDVK